MHEWMNCYVVISGAVGFGALVALPGGEEKPAAVVKEVAAPPKKVRDRVGGTLKVMTPEQY